MNEYFRSFPTDDISKRMQMKHCIRRFRSAVELQIGRLEDFMVPTTNTRKKKKLRCTPLEVKIWIKHCLASLHLFSGKISPALWFFRNSHCDYSEHIKNFKIVMMKTHIKQKSQRYKLWGSPLLKASKTSIFLRCHHQCPHPLNQVMLQDGY